MSKKKKTTKSTSSTACMFEFDPGTLANEIEQQTLRETADRKAATPTTAAEEIPSHFYQPVMKMCEVDKAVNLKLKHLNSMLNQTDAMEKDKRRVIFENISMTKRQATAAKKDIALDWPKAIWGHYIKAVEYAGSPEALLAVKLAVDSE